jgi:1,4-alpha-glucan branching enzyme
VNFSDEHNSVISYFRIANHERFLCVHNFTPTYYPDYYIHLGVFKAATEVFNSDAEKYGGSGKINQHPELIQGPSDSPDGIKIHLAPLATMIFRID